MNFRNRLHTISTLAVVSHAGCGGQVGQDLPGMGGAYSDSSTQATGGATSGGAIAVSGGSPTYDTSYCGGLFESDYVCGFDHHESQSSPTPCTYSLQWSPPDPERILIVIDCEKMSLVRNNQLDAGNQNGFAIDYEVIPANLVLMGSACDLVQSPGNHTIDCVTGC